MIITHESNISDWNRLYKIYTCIYGEKRYGVGHEKNYCSFEKSSEYAGKFLLEKYGIEIIPAKELSYKGFAIFWVNSVYISFKIIDTDKYMVKKLSDFD